MRPPIKELKKVILYYKYFEMEYEVKMNVTIPLLNKVLKDLKNYEKAN
jgi:hypothetical protein